MDHDDKSGTHIVPQLKNYFKNVSENKEISKLVSLLSTSINSTKKVNLITKGYVHIYINCSCYCKRLSIFMR